MWKLGEEKSKANAKTENVGSKKSMLALIILWMFADNGIFDETVFWLQDRLMTYQDSGFSEEDHQDHQVTTCLMKTPSGSIYIQPTSKITMIIDITIKDNDKHNPAHK